MPPTPHYPTSTFFLAGLLVAASYAVTTVAEAKSDAPAPEPARQERSVQPDSQRQPIADPVGIVDAINRTFSFLGH